MEPFREAYNGGILSSLRRWPSVRSLLRSQRGSTEPGRQPWIKYEIQNDETLTRGKRVMNQIFRRLSVIVVTPDDYLDDAQAVSIYRSQNSRIMERFLSRLVCSLKLDEAEMHDFSRLQDRELDYHSTAKARPPA